MPIALDPNETVDVVLDVDQAKPADRRPTFHARFLTSRARREVDRLLREAAKDILDPANIAKIDQVLAMELSGWTGVNDRDGNPIEFTLDKGTDGIERLVCDHVLTDEERFDLAVDCLAGTGRIGELDKKKSRSLARSAGAGIGSAPTAGRTDNATSPPANPMPISSPAPSAMDGDQTTAPAVTESEPTPLSNAPSSS